MKVTHCDRCKGVGYFVPPESHLRIVQDCPDCDGTGHIIVKDGDGMTNNLEIGCDVGHCAHNFDGLCSLNRIFINSSGECDNCIGD